MNWVMRRHKTVRYQREKLGENFPPNYFKIFWLLDQNMPLTEYSTGVIFVHDLGC